jgi:hypothetical protein
MLPLIVGSGTHDQGSCASFAEVRCTDTWDSIHSCINLLWVRQGIYSGEGDIVVLCAYLGQLSEIRKQLANEVTTVLDERDLVAMADAEEAAQEDRVLNGQTPTVGVEHVKVSHRV